MIFAAFPSDSESCNSISEQEVLHVLSSPDRNHAAQPEEGRPERHPREKGERQDGGQPASGGLPRALEAEPHSDAAARQDEEASGEGQHEAAEKNVRLGKIAPVVPERFGFESSITHEYEQCGKFNYVPFPRPQRT